jgi:hypothetical protein
LPIGVQVRDVLAGSMHMVPSRSIIPGTEPAPPARAVTSEALTLLSETLTLLASSAARILDERRIVMATVM